MADDAILPRIDKWLWEVRLYKTRSQATEACNAGKIKIDGISVKPSRNLKIGVQIIVSQVPLIKTIVVKGYPKSRIAAKLVPEFMEDLTPQSEYDKLKLMNEMNLEHRSRGTGRPTKKHRRMIDQLKSQKEDWD